ncbi:MAG: hypothetical protein ACR2QE_04045 [Acidimicrobiales bacterium]
MRRRLVTVVAALAVLASGCTWVTVLDADPGRGGAPVRILDPAPATQIEGDGDVEVEVRLKRTIDADSFLAYLRTGSTPQGNWREVTDEFVLDGRRTSATLSTTEPGVAKLVVLAWRSNGSLSPKVATTTWSWEPDVETEQGCDPLDPARCVLPFPNDHFTRRDPTSDTGRRVDFVAAAMPTNVDGDPVDPTELNRNDGFSPGSAIVTKVPGLDPAASQMAPITDIERSLDPDSPIVIIDTVTGAQHLHWAELDSNATSDDTRVLFIRPGVNFEEGRRYVVALRNLVDGDGQAIEPSRAFRLYRDRIPTFEPAIEARRPAVERLFGTLRRAGVERNELYLAWDFTVASERNLSERMLHIRDDAFASLDGAAPNFSVTAVQDEADSLIQRRVWGLFEVPLYLTGDGLPGSRFEYGGSTDVDALPVRNGTYTARFVCNIPRSASNNGADPVTPSRGTVYGHGLLGEYQQTNSFSQRSMANESNMTYCGTDWIGMASEDIPHVATLLTDLSGFPTLADRVQQGILNTLFLGRLLKDPNGFASDPAFRAGASDSSVLVPGEVYFEGISQGGIIGGAATAVSTEWTSAALGVPGMNYSTLLRRSVDFDVYALLLNPSYPDEIDRAVGLSIIQMLWDRGEANGYAHHMTDDPYPGTPPHRVILHEAFGDHQVANVATEVEARTIGAHLVSPGLAPGRHSDVDPFFGIPPVPSYPFGGSALVVWDSGNPHPPITNVPPRPPDYGVDPHANPRHQVSARLQKSAFLQLDGVLIDVCNEAPCLAP